MIKKFFIIFISLYLTTLLGLIIALVIYYHFKNDNVVIIEDLSLPPINMLKAQADFLHMNQPIVPFIKIDRPPLVIELETSNVNSEQVEDNFPKPAAECINDVCKWTDLFKD